MSVGYDREARENLKTAQNYFKANKKLISGSTSIDTSNFLMQIADCQAFGDSPGGGFVIFTSFTAGKLQRPRV
jgi:ATP-dependent Lon protease